MCILYTYTNTCMPRFGPSGFFGPFKCLVPGPTPGLTSSTPCAVCVCACEYTHILPRILLPTSQIGRHRTTLLLAAFWYTTHCDLSCNLGFTQETARKQLVAHCNIDVIWLYALVQALSSLSIVRRGAFSLGRRGDHPPQDSISTIFAGVSIPGSSFWFCQKPMS